MINKWLDACQFYGHLTKFALLMQTILDKNLSTTHIFLQKTERQSNWSSNNFFGRNLNSENIKHSNGRPTRFCIGTAALFHIFPTKVYINRAAGFVSDSVRF